MSRQITRIKTMSGERQQRQDILSHNPKEARQKTGHSSEHYRRAVVEKAYDLWEKRGRPEGTPHLDWEEAEAALKPLWSADLSYTSS